ncbi:ethanolamine utilization cob(I)yrinic acid a,c-diamide adenosyltransferase EutT [Entomohabitans teleogrylli]|uniref:ethanolamine utilization cob(I)yrinic acid a,c-diamide adenosyltransferase EutT n=1 Tax=Entomohabitans teleogrylli TaxID=1384589 RepID=UPI00073D20E2|nr:ethanolamine utilization cob(I)yrinic acid a,c-diamide adenosyltransferase EutT [Entomohabitans teleogrylli]
MGEFVTEAWLRAHHSLSEGSEIHLPADCRLTPSARELLEARRLRVKFQDAQGRLFIERPGEDGEAVRAAVHGLTSEATRRVACCELCRQAVSQKPDTLTHLNAGVMVAKNDPRLAFRAALDSSIALTVWLQTEMHGEVLVWLSDIRSLLGNIMRADALEETLAPQHIAGLDEADIHRLSHQPLRWLGHDHLVPEAVHGREVAQLNLLRARIRETEIQAAQTFIDGAFHVARPDLLQALNRLSSAVYVAMILCLTAGWAQIAALKQRLQEESHAA